MNLSALIIARSGILQIILLRRRVIGLVGAGGGGRHFTIDKGKLIVTVFTERTSEHLPVEQDVLFDYVYTTIIYGCYIHCCDREVAVL